MCFWFEWLRSNLRYRIAPWSLPGRADGCDAKPVAMAAIHGIHDCSGFARGQNIAPIEAVGGIERPIDVIGAGASDLAPTDTHGSIRLSGADFYMRWRIELTDAGRLRSNGEASAFDGRFIATRDALHIARFLHYQSFEDADLLIHDAGLFFGVGSGGLGRVVSGLESRSRTCQTRQIRRWRIKFCVLIHFLNDLADKLNFLRNWHLSDGDFYLSHVPSMKAYCMPENGRTGDSSGSGQFGDSSHRKRQRFNADGSDGNLREAAVFHGCPRDLRDGIVAFDQHHHPRLNVSFCDSFCSGRDKV